MALSISLPTLIHLVRRWRQLALVLMSLPWLVLAPSPAHAAGPLDGEFQIHSAFVVVEGGVVKLNAHIQFPDNALILQALKEGVTLDFDVDVTINRVRHFWFNATLLDTTLRRELSYHAVSERFVVQDHDNQESFATLEEALEYLGHLADVPIAVTAQLAGTGPYLVAVRAGVRRGHMPAALRAVMFWSDDWRRASDWYSWTLMP